jgi:hypothetical protein
MIVIKAVRINSKLDANFSNPIITGCMRVEDAIVEAKNGSGLSKYPSWHFLKFGELVNGDIKKDGKFDAQVNNIKRGEFNKRK